MSFVIEYSLDGGVTWHHGRTIAAWAKDDADTLAGQRKSTRDHARDTHGSTESVITRVLPDDDPRGVLASPVRAPAVRRVDADTVVIDGETYIRKPF